MKAELLWRDEKDERHTIWADFQAWPRKDEFIEICAHKIIWLRVRSVTHMLARDFVETRVVVSCVLETLVSERSLHE